MKDSARLTVDMTIEEHMLLKMASAKIGITMKELVLSATFKALSDLEDQWLANQAKDTLKKIMSGEKNTILE